MSDYKVLNDIGEYIGLQMYQIEKGEDKNYYRAVIYKFEDIWFLRYRKYFGDDHSSVYVINLSTMKPTKNSPIQKPLSNDLKQRLIAYHGNR